MCKYFPIYVAFLIRVLLFSFFVYSVILFRNFDGGVFSIILRLALPTITASTPSETYFFTSAGVDTPNPIPIGNFPPTTYMALFTASIVYL